MILRVLRYSTAKKRNGGRFPTYYCILYQVVAYEVKERKSDGRKFYHKHHTVVSGLLEEQLLKSEYANLPMGSLHNRTVEGVVIEKLDRCLKL